MYKIGYTSNLNDRLYTLQSGNPFLKVIYQKETNNGKSLEGQIHDKYMDKKYEREWFTIDDIDACISFIETL